MDISKNSFGWNDSIEQDSEERKHGKGICAAAD